MAYFLENPEGRRLLTMCTDRSDDSKNCQKITGYLEKRGTLMSLWKRYWFVLDGHLLLYYGSKEEYDALSPCKGSITLGPSCAYDSPTPLKFQISTRSGSVLTLRAESTDEELRWLKAIHNTVYKKKDVDISPINHRHFDYPMENPEQQKQTNSPGPSDAESQHPKTAESNQGQILERLQKIGARSYCDSIVSDHQIIMNSRPMLKEQNLPTSDNNPTHKNIVPEKGMVTSEMKQNSPNTTKIDGKPAIPQAENVIHEEEDFCVCTYEKKEENAFYRKTHNSTQRSISFLEARKVFNVNQQHTIEADDKSKSKEPYEENMSLKDENTNRREKKSDCIDNEIKKNQINEEIIEEKPRESDIVRRSSNSFQDESEDHKNPNDVTEISNSNLNIQTSETTLLNSSKYIPISRLIENPSRVSLLGAYYNNEESEETSNFCENELYERQGGKEISCQSTEYLYSELEPFEETPPRKDCSEFQFPPPPSEYYESVDNLNSDEKNRDGEEFSHGDEEYLILQNDIYCNTDNRDDMQIFEGDDESDNSFYDEVNSSIVDHRKMEEELYTEPHFQGDLKKPRPKSEIFENHMYEVVQVRKQNRKHGATIEKENDTYVRFDKGSCEGPKNTEAGIEKYMQRKQKTLYEKEIDDFLVSEENDLYEEYKEDSPKDLIPTDAIRNLNMSSPGSKSQIDKLIYPVSKQVSCRNSNPKSKFNENNNSNRPSVMEWEEDNELYAVININSSKDIKHHTGLITKQYSSEKYDNEPKSTFSRNDSKHERKISDKTEMNEMSGASKIEGNRPSPHEPHPVNLQCTRHTFSSTYPENELYSEPGFHSSIQGASHYHEPDFEKPEREKRPIKQADEMNVYEDPHTYGMIPSNSDEKKTSRKSEDLKKKQNNIFLRLLKQVTRKHGEESDKGAQFSSGGVDETRVLLAEYQKLLERKKNFIEKMVPKSPKVNHRRIQSEADAHFQNNDEDRLAPVTRTLSIDLNEEYSEVRDCCNQEDEVIYSEVEMIGRNPEEFKDFIENLLESFNNTDHEDCAGNI